MNLRFIFPWAGLRPPVLTRASSPGAERGYDAIVEVTT